MTAATPLAPLARGFRFDETHHPGQLGQFGLLRRLCGPPGFA
jgi:hypothetical protein